MNPPPLIDTYISDIRTTVPVPECISAIGVLYIFQSFFSECQLLITMIKVILSLFQKRIKILHKPFITQYINVTNHAWFFLFTHTVMLVFVQQAQQGAPKLLANTLFSMRGRRWKQARNILTPAFSAARLRQVCYNNFNIINSMCKPSGWLHGGHLQSKQLLAIWKQIKAIY